MFGDILLGLLIWVIVIGLLVAAGPWKKLHRILLSDLTPLRLGIIAGTATIVILFLILPMGLDPVWNGENHGHRNQYEVMADSLLEGHLDLRYDDDSIEDLDKLENPYDPKARSEAKIYYHWDHAFYNHKYYMYFGIVPVILLFLPFKAIFGVSLTTYHATQVFVLAGVIGMYMLLYELARRFLKKLPYVTFLYFAAAVSLLSFWYATGCPALYCTAITAGICMEVWSLFFFFRAVFIEKEENKQILFAALGSLFGALTFGCRPTIGLANILVIPLLVVYLQKKKSITKELVLKLILAALPYVVIGVLLMVYNAVRFGSPFEFGQRWQLTNADQSNYSFLSQLNIGNEIKGMGIMAFGLPRFSKTFPFIGYFGGIFINFPLLLFTLVPLLFPAVRERIRRFHLKGFVITYHVTIFLMLFMCILYTPYINERYRMDEYFLAGIMAFLLMGFLHAGMPKKKQRRVVSSVACFLSVAAICTAFLFFLVPNNSNYAMNNSDFLQHVLQILTFRLAG
ncbi:MAG: hypothetical protein IKI54_05350 [Lachnospiraceae bacterium]|nr:hypothetical protein [Lachnospiraceae bacterium]